MTNADFVSEWLDQLFQMKNGRRFLTICGGEWGDGGKGGVESAILPHFDVNVRVSGGANTGRTRNVTTKTGEEVEFVFHLMPSGLADGKMSFIGDWVLMDLERFAAEKNQLIQTIGGELTAPLYISPKAPLFLPYHRFLEAYLEYCMGAKAVKTTGRGIGPMIASVDLRICPRTGHLVDPDTLREWVARFWLMFEDMFRKIEPQLKKSDDKFSLDDYTPDKVVEKLLADASGIMDHIAFDYDSRLIDLAERNVPTIFSLTQGWGLHSRGTYPMCSSTQITAQAAAYCSGIPMKYFGPVIQVGKLDPTRVGAGCAPTHMWDRLEAEAFPEAHPELFSILDECDEVARTEFLQQMLQKINSGKYTDVDVAQYWQVLLNELGATTKRGREILWPDLFATACAAKSNGADCLALTRIDALSGMKFDLKLGHEYRVDGQVCKVPDYPTPIERLEKVEVTYDTVPIDLRGVNLAGIDDENDIHPQISGLLEKWEGYAGVPVGIASFSGGRDGKIFRKVG